MRLHESLPQYEKRIKQMEINLVNERTLFENKKKELEEFKKLHPELFLPVPPAPIPQPVYVVPGPNVINKSGWFSK